MGDILKCEATERPVVRGLYNWSLKFIGDKSCFCIVSGGTARDAINAAIKRFKQNVPKNRHYDIQITWDTCTYASVEFLTSMTSTRHIIKPAQAPSNAVYTAREWLASVADMLKAKNEAYGNSATEPMRIFSRSDAGEGLRVRIDDKLSRIARGDGSGDEDTLKDLVGYIALLAASGGKADK